MLLLALVIAVVIFDQASKEMIRTGLPIGDQIPVIGGLFNLSHVRNTGAAWGMLAGLGPWLIAASVLTLVALVFFRHSFLGNRRLERVSAACLIAGIVGNLIDRVRLGYVVDFLDFYWQSHHFPSFNVADSAICIGVGLYMLSQWQRDREGRGTAVADAGPGAP